MITAAVSTKGQVTIPVSIRQMFALKPFDQLVFTVSKRQIIAAPVQEKILSLYGSVKTKGKSVDLKELRKIMVQKLGKTIATEGL